MKALNLKLVRRSTSVIQGLGVAIGLFASGSALASDLVVTVRNAGTDNRGAIVRVDATTGARTLISDLGDPTQGAPLGATVSGISIDADGNFVVLDRTGGTNGRSLVFRVDAVTGQRELVSDLGDPAQGPVTANPEAVHLLPDGDYFVPEEDHARPGLALLYRIDHVTGQRTVLNDLTDPTLGPTAVQAERGAIELVPGGFNILLTDQNAGTAGQGALFRIDPVTNIRTLLSDLGNPAQGPVQVNSEAVVLERNGNVIVVEGDNPNASVLRINPVTGERALVSDFGDPTQGPIGISVGETGAIEASGSLLLVGAVRPEGEEEEEEGEEEEAEEEDENVRRVLLRVDTQTGNRTIFSDFGDPAQGLVGSPSHVAVIESYLGYAATLVGTEGADVLLGTPDNDVILGLGGDDSISGGGGQDIVVGGFGNDVLNGEDGDDILAGGNGGDDLDGGAGVDILDNGHVPETAVNGESVFNLP
jgi:hemolysin type calcium-binding protein